MSTDVESVAVIKTHLLSLFTILVILGIIVKFILPKFTSLIGQKLALDKEKADAERLTIQRTLERWTESQEKVNLAILSQFDSMNKNIIAIKDAFSSLKSLKVLLIIFGLSISCDSDTITVYKMRPKKTEEVKQYHVQEKDLGEPKPCNPPCNPPKTKCNTKTGDCEGQSVREPSTDMTFFIDKFGVPVNSVRWR